MPATRPGQGAADAVFAPNVAAPGSARAWLREQLQAWGLAKLAEKAELCASELVANAVRYSRRNVKVHAEVRSGRLHVEVHDEDPQHTPHKDTAGPDDEHGRGLIIVSAVAEAWGVDPTPQGKAVWFEVC